MALSAGAVLADNIDPAGDGSRFAFGENVGWLNLKPAGGVGVSVGAGGLTGYIWGENVGWINVSPPLGGVVNDGSGNLSGYAWGENVGWINFAPAGGGVFINACGEFNGTAYGENIGWISFRSGGAVPFKVTTSWLSPIDNVPPVTAITTPAPLRDWYNTDTSVIFSATDCGSGVKEVHYSLNSGPSVTTPGPTATTGITAEGCTDLGYFSVDNTGNAELTKSARVCIDKTPPVVSITSPANNQTYNINSVLTANYTVADSGSGVASTTVTAQNGAPVNTSAAGAFAFSVTAIDRAGNQRSLANTYTIVYPGNIDPSSANCQYAWGENVGWINFKPSWGPGVTVTDSAVTGEAWGENIGWINLSPANGGVSNNGSGKLSGYAWGENVGWINFSPANGGVRIGTDGRFTGQAWGENIGWINFSSANACVRTAWLAPLRPGDVNGDGTVNCADIAVVKASFGKRQGQAGFDARADVVKDGVVDVRDLAFVSSKLPAGTRCP